MRITEEYNNCIDTLKSKASYFSYKYNLDYDEVMSVANETFCFAFRSYNENRSSEFIYWLRYLLNRHLKSMLYQSREIPNTELTLSLIENKKKFIDKTSEIIYMQQQINNFSKKTRIVLKAILYPNRKEIKMYSTRGITKNSIKKHFVRKGWKQTTIYNCFREIQTGLDL